MTTLIYFTAPWCQPCKTFGPRLTEVAGSLGIPIVKVDADEQGDLVTEFKVMSLPTVIVMHDGVQVDTLIGAKNERDLRNSLTQYATA